MRGLISSVDDNYVDNRFKEILVYVYHCSVENNRPRFLQHMLQTNEKAKQPAYFSPNAMIR